VIFESYSVRVPAGYVYILLRKYRYVYAFSLVGIICLLPLHVGLFCLASSQHHSAEDCQGSFRETLTTARGSTRGASTYLR